MEISESAHRLIWLCLEAGDADRIIDMVRISRGGLHAQSYICYPDRADPVRGALLQLACRYSNSKLIEFLLSMPGTDANYEGVSNETPMFAAMMSLRNNLPMTWILDLFAKSGKPLQMDVKCDSGGGLTANYLGLADWTNMREQVVLKLMKMGARDRPYCFSFHHRASVLEEDSLYIKLYESRIVVLAALEAQYQSKRRWMPLEMWQRLVGMLSPRSS